MITEIAKKLAFPQEAIDCFEQALDKIMSDKEASYWMIYAMDSMFLDEDGKFEEILKKVSEKSGVHQYTTDMVFLLLCTRPLRYIYKQEGLSDELYYDTMADLRYKLMECKNVYGIWGTFVTGWFKEFFVLNRFKLGRMQYDKENPPYHEIFAGNVKENDVACWCHIPSCGALKLDDVKQSLREAYAFHKNGASDCRLVVMCHSWLFYTPIIQKLNENSNIRKFYDLFEVLRVDENETNGDFWRVFNVEYSDEVLENVVVDNSLKAAIVEHLKAGGTMGEGIGMIIVDGNF